MTKQVIHLGDSVAFFINKVTMLQKSECEGQYFVTISFDSGKDYSVGCATETGADNLYKELLGRMVDFAAN